MGAHGALMTYYDCIRTPIIAHALDLFEQGVIKHKTDLEFANDIVKISYGQLYNWNKEECFPLASFGQFYPAVMKNPENFIVP